MPKIKKRMRQALALFFSLFFIVAPLIPASQVHAEDLCCNSGYTLANGTPAAITECGIGPQAYDTTTCCQRTGVLGHTVQPSFFCDPAKAATTPTCNWTLLKNSQSAYNNKPAFCMGNFSSKADLRSHSVQLGCDGLTCGGLLGRFINTIGTTTGNTQIVSLADTDNANIGVGNNDTNYTCITGDLDKSVIDTYNASITKKNAACALILVADAGVVVGAGFTGGALLPVAIAVTAGAGATYASCKSDISTIPAPNIVAKVLDSSGHEQCRGTLPINIEIQDIKEETPQDNNTFDLCNQIPDPTLQKECRTCNTSNGGDAQNPKAIWTSVGCIPTTSNAIVGALVKLGLGIAGTVAILMILAGGFMLSTSQGDTKRVGEARELITSAVIGLLFIIFSVALLQFIGVKIFQIPGF